MISYYSFVICFVAYYFEVAGIIFSFSNSPFQWFVIGMIHLNRKERKKQINTHSYIKIERLK